MAVIVDDPGGGGGGGGGGGPPDRLANAKNDTASTAEDTYVDVAVLANDTDADGDAITVTAVTQAANGTVSINANGTVRYTPNLNFSGSDSFSYTVNGGDTATVSVTVTPVNDAPADIALSNLNVAEGAAVGTLVGTLSATDVDNASGFTWTLIDNPGDRFQINGNRLEVKGVLDFETAASHQVTIRVTDAGGQSRDEIFTVGVTDVATTYDITLGTMPGSLSEGASATLVVTRTGDLQGAGSVDFTVSGTGTNPTQSGDFGTPTTGTLLFAAGATSASVPVLNKEDALAEPSETFRVVLSNPVGGVLGVGQTPVLTLANNDVNAAPVANDDTATTDEETSVIIAVLANDTDADGDAIEVIAVDGGSYGDVTILSDGTIAYTPEENYFGEDSFTYTVTGGATATVHLTINNVNDPARAEWLTLTAWEDQDLEAQLQYVDYDPQDLVDFAIVLGPEHGEVFLDEQSGQFTYTPDPDYNGPDFFTYSVFDGTSTDDGGRVYLTVTPEPDLAVANHDEFLELSEDVPVDLNVLANDTDADGDPITVTGLIEGPAHGTITFNLDGSLRYTPDADFHGSDGFDYEINDGEGYAHVSIGVLPVEDLAVANNDAATTAEDTANDIAVLANDTAGDDGISVTAVTAGANGTVAINPNGTVRYTPNANFNGADSFTYTVTGGDTATVNVTVTAVDDAAVGVDDAATTAEDTATDIAVLANDTDVESDAIGVTAVSQGANGSVAINPNGTVRYTPNANFNGADSFTYTVTGGDTATVNVTVTAVDDAAVGVDDAANTAEDTAIDIAVLANDTDVEGDAISVTAVGPAANGTVSILQNGTVRYTPNANFNGADSFTYMVTGGDTATVNVTVTAADDAPVANDDSTSTAEDTAKDFVVLFNDTDVEGDAIVVTAVTQGANGSVSINADGTVRYTPNANFNGQDSFSYTVNGGDTASVTVTVTTVDDAAVANDDTTSTAEDTAKDIAVLFNDTDLDGDPISVTGVTQAANGSVAINGDGTVRYTPNANFNGQDSFTYTVNGGDAATVNVTVTPVNDAPTAAALPNVSSPEDTPVNFQVAAFSDIDGDSLTYTAKLASGSPLPTWLTFDGLSRTFTGTPPANFNGVLALLVTASDGALSAADEFNLTITAVNDAPQAQADAVGVNEDATTGNLVQALLANDDVDGGDPMSIQGVNTAGTKGTVTFNAQTQSLSYAADHDDFDLLGVFGNPNTATDTFTYTMVDGNGVSSNATVTVTVTGVADGLTSNGTTGNNTQTGGTGEDTLSGLAGNDSLVGLGGSDSLNGGVGNDTLDGGAGHDRVVAGDGNDRANGGLGSDTLEGGDGLDDLDGGDGNDSIDGGRGDDTVRGGAGLDRVAAGDGNDRVWGDADADTLAGEIGDDTLFGGAAADSLSGGTGNDFLDGGAGSDTAGGGIGVDVFSFGVGGGADRDLVTDFASGERIRLEGGLTLSSASSASDVTGDGARDTVLTLSDGHVIVLASYTAWSSGAILIA